MTDSTRFNLPARLLHWSMAALILTMLLIGVAMVTSLADYHALVALHRPLGLLILLLAVLRLANRWRRPPPPLPRNLPVWQRRAAHASHIVLYGLMLAMPLVASLALRRRRAVPLYQPEGMTGPVTLRSVVGRSRSGIELAGSTSGWWSRPAPVPAMM